MDIEDITVSQPSRNNGDKPARTRTSRYEFGFIFFKILIQIIVAHYLLVTCAPEILPVEALAETLAGIR